MKRDETVRSSLILFAVFFIPVVWAALLTAPSLSGGLPEILANLTEAMNDPLHIQWVDDSLKCILLFAAAYGMGIGIYLSTKRNYRRWEEHGCSTIIKTVGLRQGKFDRICYLLSEKRGNNASLSANF